MKYEKYGTLSKHMLKMKYRHKYFASKTTTTGGGGGGDGGRGGGGGRGVGAHWSERQNTAKCLKPQEKDAIKSFTQKYLVLVLPHYIMNDDHGYDGHYINSIIDLTNIE